MVGYLQVESIEKIYDEIKALDSMTLDIEPSKVISLVGINGSGKTTFLRILAGLEELSAGNIQFNSKRISTIKLRQVSTIVFQKTIMFNSSVFDNVAFGLKVRGFNTEEIRNKVTQALDSVGLNNYQKRKAKKLSGGEQQRVALARAFVIEPEILLLDEPTSNLDPTNAIIIENAIKKMRKRKVCTIILATHNLHQAKRLSDIMIHIHFGKILEIANPEDFFTNPSNLITKKFINGELQF